VHALQAKTAVVIQSHLRGYLARKELQERQYVFKSLIKIQSFVRMVIAKRRARLAREKRSRKEAKRVKKLQKKFQGRDSAKQSQKTIETYIDNILEKEIRQQKEMKAKRRDSKCGMIPSIQTPVS